MVTTKDELNYHAHASEKVFRRVYNKIRREREKMEDLMLHKLMKQGVQ
jgi:hypothetical protein